MQHQRAHGEQRRGEVHQGLLYRRVGVRGVDQGQLRAVPAAVHRQYDQPGDEGRPETAEEVAVLSDGIHASQLALRGRDGPAEMYGLWRWLSAEFRDAVHSNLSISQIIVWLWHRSRDGTGWRHALALDVCV